MKSLRIVVLLLSVLCLGCADIAHKYQRTVFGIDCRQDKLQHGQCIAAR